MGNCFSDPSSKPKGKGQVLGSGPKPSTINNASSPTTNTGSIAKKQNYQGSSPATLGGSAGEQGSERERALAAAEERAKAVSPSVSERLHVLLLLLFCCLLISLFFSPIHSPLYLNYEY
jgi:hypothetical protein